MFGGVGTGKTMLMDLLVNSAPPQFKVHPCALLLGKQEIWNQHVWDRGPKTPAEHALHKLARVLI